MFKIEASKNCQKIPPYIFIELDNLKKAAIAKGKDIIDLGIGDPDQPTPGRIIKAMQEAVTKPENHRYPLGAGKIQLREKLAEYYKTNFNVHLDPVNEVMALIGSKEGIAHLHTAVLNPGDIVLVPEPGYPVYSNMTLVSGGVPFYMPLLAQNNFLPDLKAIPEDVLEKAKIMWLNYPNNPTSALATVEFFKEVIEIANKYNIIICHDAAYIDMGFDDYKPLSFLSIDGAKEVGVEYYSLSKPFNMTGWRIAFIAGNPNVIKVLSKVKANCDSGVFGAVQDTAIEALSYTKKELHEIIDVYKERRNIIVPALKEMGWELDEPKASFYLWIKTINGMKSMEMSRKVLEECSVIVTPGIGFGQSGDDYVRIALTVEKERLAEAIKRLKKL